MLIIYLLATLGVVCVGLTREYGRYYALLLTIVSLAVPQIGAAIAALYIIGLIFAAGSAFVNMA